MTLEERETVGWIKKQLNFMRTGFADDYALDKEEWHDNCRKAIKYLDSLEKEIDNRRHDNKAD
ncbi:MAG: hypothetical protein IKS48_00140 [Eubacterium sp.]|nr:hypothetical protein [Eubacterium sp.]